jgi:hypothetical protein
MSVVVIGSVADELKPLETGRLLGILCLLESHGQE